MKLTVWAVILGIPRELQPAVAEPVVTEYRVIETQIQQDIYNALPRRDTSISIPTCAANKELCSASGYPQINSCIPTNSLCCNYAISVGYCPTTARCGNARFPGCAATDPVVVVAPTTVVITSASSTPTASGSGTGAGAGLATGSIIGISVSVACSVLGLIFGLGFYQKQSV